MPSIPFTLTLLALALPAVWVSAVPLTDNIWWVLKNGQVLVERGSIGTSDPFTFAPHIARDVNAQWLAQLIYYGTYRALGLEGVLVCTAVVAVATFGLVLHIAWRRTHSLSAASAAIGASVVVSLGQLVPRAQTLSFLPYAATYWLLSCAPRRAGTILGLAVVEAVWANLHGSFFVGPLLTGVWLAGHAIERARGAGWRAVLVSREARFLSLALAAQAIATLATPNSIELYAYTWRLSSYSIVRQYVVEWAPTSVAQPTGLAFFASVALLVGGLIHARRGPGVIDLLLLAVFGVMGLQAVRNVIWWALILGPVLATVLASLSLPARMVALGRAPGSARHNVARLGIVALLLIGASPWVKASDPFIPEAYRGLVPVSHPSRASAFLLTQDLPPHVYADLAWSSYLDWRLWPRYQVMVDSSFETHPPEVWLDVLALDQGHASWQEKLDRYGVDVLLLDRLHQARLVEAVERSPDWRTVYADDVALVFARSGAAS